MTGIMTPRSASVMLYAAMVALTAKRESWSGAAKSAADASKEWAQQDKLSGRIRAQCVQKLIDSGVAKTAAQTAASDHPDYTVYRDHLAELAETKERAIMVRDETKEEMEEAKLVLQARIEQFRSQPRGEFILISRDLGELLCTMATATNQPLAMELQVALGERAPEEESYAPDPRV